MTSNDLLSVITIGGYLGSGKTTLVNHLLRHANGLRLAVLVNEFGELAIDEDLIVAEDENLISIAGGCICCSFGNDLIGALDELRALSPPPDYVVIESSGVAIPGAIVSTFSLGEGFRSEGLVVVVDAETIRDAAENDYIGDTVTRQLQDAEILVINKLDLVRGEDHQALTDWLSEMAPRAGMIPTRYGAVAPEAILGSEQHPGQGRRQSHSDALFESLVLRPEQPVDAMHVARFLATDDLGVIRAKGHVLGTDGQAWLVQTVGKRWQATPVSHTGEHGIVCLGFRDHLNRDTLLTATGSA